MSDLADNALYWRGEVLYAQRQYGRALRQFEGVLASAPDGDRVPDALYKIGLCHRRMGEPQRAREAFERLRTRFPDSKAARLASQEDAS